MKVLDLSQDFSMHTPAFATYTGPSIKWVKRLAFDKAGGQEITSTLHVSTHLDAPAHFLSGGKFIGDLPLDWLIGPACVVDLERMGVGDYDLYGPAHFERWEKDTGLRIERDDILVIHTGYHRYYPENWADGRAGVDETRYFIRHPGPTREFADWVLARGLRWLAVDAGGADHAMNTVIRLLRADEAGLGWPAPLTWWISTASPSWSTSESETVASRSAPARGSPMSRTTRQCAGSAPSWRRRSAR